MKKRIVKNRISLGEAQPHVVVNENLSATVSSSRKRHIVQIAIAIVLFLLALAIVFYFIFFFKRPDSVKKEGSSIFNDLFPQEETVAPSEVVPTTSNADLLKGIRLYNVQNYPDAISAFYEVTESDASDEDKSEALIYLGRIELANENFTKAIDYFKRSLKYNDKNHAAYIETARAYTGMNDLDRAIDYIDMAIEKRPDLDDAFVAKGNILFKQKKFKAAADMYKHATSINSDNAYAHYNRALSLLKTGERTEAMEELKLAGTSDKGRIAYLSYSRLGSLSLEENNVESAIKYLNYAINLNSNSPEDLFNLGLAYLKKDDKDRAIDYFTKAEETGSDDIILLQGLADVYSSSYNNYAKGIDLYKKVAAKNSRNVTVLKKLGELYYKSRDFNAALVYFRRITEIEPASENARQALLYMGTIYDENERYEDAIDAYQKSLNINPRDDETLYFMGQSYNNSGDTINAIQTWRKAYSINPDNPRPLIALADLLYSTGHLDEAQNEYSKIAEKWPANSEALFSLATIFNKKGNTSDAMKYYKQVINLDIDKELTRKSLINLALLSVDTENETSNNESLSDSVMYMKKALMHDPNEPETLYALGIIYYKKTLYDQAIEAFYQVIKGSNESKEIAEAYNYIGKSYYKLKDYKKAIRAFSLGIEEDPGNEEIRINRRAASSQYEESLGE
ncbi:MAG: tetratricopeptide repeat protein [Spirochaetes bacterium]|jgi:tetratricopeptide (TPR) repeat protein|nr:tetratricopeptide repeat protein [Spirochaetota bacterium]